MLTRTEAPSATQHSSDASGSRWPFAVEAGVVALAYLAVSWLAIQLAPPPGYATAVWPAAGIALVATLRRRATGLTGAWLGSCLTNGLASYSLAPNASMGDSVLFGAATGIGPLLHAFIGSLLIRRFVSEPRLLLSDRDVLGFLVLGGPIASIFSATAGSISLEKAGVVSAEALPFNWFTWWMGDSIGVVLFAPLTLIITERGNAVWRQRRRSVGIPLLVASGATIGACFAVERWDERRSRQLLDQRSQNVTASFIAEVDRHTRSLESLAGFFECSDVVTPDEFTLMVRNLSKMAGGVQCAHWIASPEGNRAGSSDMELKAVFEVDFEAMGADGSEPASLPKSLIHTHEAEIRAAIAKLAVSGEPVLSAPSIRFGEAGKASAVASLVAATYRPVRFSESVASREQAQSRELSGFVVYEIDLGLLARRVTLCEPDSDLQTAVIDTTGGESNLVILDTPDAIAKQVASASPLAATPAEIARSKVRFGGRELELQSAWLGGEDRAHRSQQAWAVLICGLSLSSLLGGFLLVLSGHAARVEQTVAARTAELQTANARLARDRHSMHKMNRVLKRSRDAARSAVHSKSEFLANMSHEIRTPMTAILGFTELLAESSVEPSMRNEYAEIVRRNGEHLLTIINDVLDVSKLDAGKLRIERVPCDLTAIVADAGFLMQVSAARKGIELVVESPSTPLPKRLLTDPTRVRQVLFNLLSNAIKFTDSGSVRVGAQLLSASGEWGRPCSIRISVVDTGIGMTADQIAHVFKPFSQADESTTRRYGGTGLGLTISRRLASLLGGTLSVQSEPGCGSSFTFDIAAEIAPSSLVDSSLTRSDSTPDTPRLAGDAGRRRRALVVDDGADNRALVRVYLSRMGIDVVEAVDGIDGVEKAMAERDRATGFDVILLDMQMPRMDGWEAARRLRAEGVRTPIIAVTAGVLSADRDRCLEAGCDDYAVKPLDPRALQQLVERLAPPAEPTRAAA